MTTTFTYPKSMDNLQLLVGDTALPISNVSIKGAVDGNGVVWVVGIEFDNILATPSDGIFNIPLPHKGAVSGMTMRVGDRVIIADIKERGQARIEFQEAKERGHTAALFEQQRAEIFTISVGSLQPGQNIRVEIVVHDEVVVDGTEASVRFPTMIKDRFVPAAVPDSEIFDTQQVGDSITTASVRIDFASPVDDAVCDTSDNVRVGKSSVSSDAFALTGDLALRWSIPMELATAKWVPDTGDSQMGTLEVIIRVPKNKTAPARKKAIQIMVDCSGSMSGHYLEWARYVAAQVIAQLDGNDIIHVATFDSIVEALDATQFGFASATRETKKKLNAELARVAARGGTQLTDALQAMGAAFGTLDDMDNSDQYERIAVLITDGAYGDEATAAFHRENELKGTRVIAVAIGENANGYLETLAANGVCVFIPSEYTLQESTSKVLSRVAAPALRGVFVECDGLTDVSPQFRPDVYPEVVKTMAGRMPRPTGDATVTVMSTDGIIMQIPVSVSDDSSVTTRWAGNFIKSLDYQMMSAVDNKADADALEKRIIELSTTHKVLSKYTAWLAIDTETNTIREVTQMANPSYDESMMFSQVSLKHFMLTTPKNTYYDFMLMSKFAEWQIEDPKSTESVSALMASIDEMQHNQTAIGRLRRLLAKIRALIGRTVRLIQRKPRQRRR